MINRRHTAPSPAMGGSHRIPNIGKTGERVVASSSLENGHESVILAVLLIAGYGLGLLFSLGTHQEIFASAERADATEPPWPLGLALVTLAVVTILVALVCEI